MKLPVFSFSSFYLNANIGQPYIQMPMVVNPRHRGDRGDQQSVIYVISNWTQWAWEIL